MYYFQIKVSWALFFLSFEILVKSLCMGKSFLDQIQDTSGFFW